MYLSLGSVVVILLVLWLFGVIWRTGAASAVVRLSHRPLASDV